MRKSCVTLALVIALSLPASSGQWEKLDFPKGRATTLLSTSRGLYASSWGRLYISRDNAQTWDSLATLRPPPTDLIEVGDMLLSTSYVMRAGLPLDPMPCVFRSRDSGHSWDSLLAGIYGSPSLVMSGSLLYANLDGGLFASADTGSTWRRIDSAGMFAEPIAEVMADGATLYVQIRADQFYRSTDQGGSWAVVDAGFPESFFCLRDRDSTVSVGSVGGEIHLSRDHGYTWRPVHAGLPFPGSFWLVRIFFVENTLLAAVSLDNVQTLYRLNLSDTTWRRFDRGLELPRVDVMYDLAASNEYLFLTAGDTVIWRRPLADLTGAGATSDFVFPFGREADEWVYEVYDNNDPWHTTRTTLRWGRDTLMANGKTYRPFSSGTYNLFYLRQEGDRIFQFAPWNSSEFARYDFSRAPGDVVARVPLEYGHDTTTIYLESDSLLRVFGGLRRTLDFRGMVWDRVIDSLGITSFSVFTETAFTLKGARIGGRIYGDLTSLEEDGKQGLPQVPELAQNYPNPFNPSTTIRYDLPHSSHVTLAVFNLLGQQVATLVNGEVEAGEHEVRFDAVGLASGVYFYRLQAGRFTQARALCLMK